MLGKQLQTAAAGSGAAEGLGIEDVFSTWLYTGNGSTQTITNGVDLAGEGGMVWCKRRDAGSHGIFDTERGIYKTLYSNYSYGEDNLTTTVTAFNSDGFSTGAHGIVNASSINYASWTFRKAPGFFDVVTYTGTGANTGSRTISHNLGSVPGMIIIKRTSGAEDWMVYHRSLGVSGGIKLNQAGEAWTGAADWYNTAPTATEFTIRDGDIATNGFNETYVAYLFAHDEAIFGENADQSVIKCGGYSGNGSSQEINLGFEPQWLLVKVASGEVDDWYIFDSMRGWNVLNNNQPTLRPNRNYAESGSHVVNPTSTGFKLPSLDLNKSGKTYIYVAIRRGPMKTPTDATTVFAIDTGTNGTSGGIVTPGFPVDMDMTAYRSLGGVANVEDRVRGYGNSNTAGATRGLTTSSTAAENTISSPYFYNAWNTTITRGGNGANPGGAGIVSWFFRRAPGFFDVVAYTGTGVAGTAINHNLGVTPEMIITKKRSGVNNWYVYHPNLTSGTQLRLNLNNAEYAGGLYSTTSPPSATDFTIQQYSDINGSGETYIAYLFATLDGISKVGSYTGTGSDINVDCGFTAGARFVLIKRTDSTGDWYVWDTARGIVAGDDPWLLLNSTQAEITYNDFIDPYASGFTVTSTAPASLNASGGSYIFLAIA